MADYHSVIIKSSQNTVLSKAASYYFIEGIGLSKNIEHISHLIHIMTTKKPVVWIQKTGAGFFANKIDTIFLGGIDYFISWGIIRNSIFYQMQNNQMKLEPSIEKVIVEIIDGNHNQVAMTFAFEFKKFKGVFYTVQLKGIGREKLLVDTNNVDLFEEHGNLVLSPKSATADFSVGKKPGKALTVDFAEVSRDHLLIRYGGSEETYELNDLDSTNGTTLNNERIKGAKDTRKLKPGNVIKFPVSKTYISLIFGVY